MTPVCQTKYGKGNGNCLTACVASILNVQISELPDFSVDNEWFDLLYQFCKDKGYTLMYWHSEALPSVLTFNAYVVMLLELDGTDETHAVVAKAVFSKKVVVEKQHDTDGGIEWSCTYEEVHDPNRLGTYPVKDVIGYIYIGKQ